MKLVFVGGGNMATAMIGGLLQCRYARDDIGVVEVDADARHRLTARFGVHADAAADVSARQSQVVVLAVKPQQLRKVAEDLQPLLAQQLVISIAAGIRTDDLARWLRGYTRIVRVMPNTPALVSAGISALYAMPAVTAAERQTAESLLQAVGSTLWVQDEGLMDAVTALSGSGPAYVFYFMEALEQAGRELGLAAEDARRLSVETFVGASKLAGAGGEDPAVLRARVTSKGGTTERALLGMQSADLKQRIVDAVKLAAARSRELGEELGRAD